MNYLVVLVVVEPVVLPKTALTGCGCNLDDNIKMNVKLLTREIPKPSLILRDLYKLNHTSFNKIIEFHTKILFRKFPPSLMVFDYTNERTFTDMIIRDFGEDRVSKI